MDPLKPLLSKIRPGFRYSSKSVVILICNYLLIGVVLAFVLFLYCFFDSSKLKFNKKLEPTTFHNLTYLRAAYRVSDTTIRLVLVRSVENKRNLTYEFGLKKGDIKLECHNTKCPGDFSPPCSINGYIGVINDLTKYDHQSYIVIFSEENEVPVFLNVKDTRKRSPKHELGVCVQPIYLHTDFSAFVQFFEFWLSENATRFYVYRESYTTEVSELLNFYANQPGIVFEFIDWTSLPLRSEPDERQPNLNPNRYWFRLEVFMSIFDCVHRAKNEVKYLAQLDLDEILYVGPKTSVIEFMHAIDRQEPEMAAVSFRSQRVQVLNGSWVNVNNPKDLSFNNLESVLLEKKVFKRPLYAKLVYKPERAFHVHIHQQLQTEKNKKTKSDYKHINVAPEAGVVLHVRRLSDMYKWTDASKSNIIQSRAQNMQNSFTQRFKDFTTKIENWNSYGLKVNEKIEKCRQEMNKNRRKACHNLYDCDRQVQDVHWIRPKDSWSYV